MADLIAGIWALWLLVLGVTVLTTLKAAAGHISAIRQTSAQEADVGDVREGSGRGPRWFFG